MAKRLVCLDQMRGGRVPSGGEISGEISHTWQMQPQGLLANGSTGLLCWRKWVLGDGEILPVH